QLSRRPREPHNLTVPPVSKAAGTPLMRIAIDATVLYGRRTGIGNFVWNLLSQLALQDQNNQYLVFVVSDAPEPPPEVAAAGARWQWHRLSFEGSQKLRRICWQQAQLPLEVRRHGCGL